MAGKYAYTSQALLDLHARTHISLRKLLKHCSELTDQQLNKKIKGFGCPSIHRQLFHVIGAEHYWISVAKDAMDVNLNPEEYPAVKDLMRFERRTLKTTREYLEKVSPKVLNTPRVMAVYGGKRRKLMPAHLVLRTQTHAFQHQGQVLAMVRILDHPISTFVDISIKP